MHILSLACAAIQTRSPQILAVGILTPQVVELGGTALGDA